MGKIGFLFGKPESHFWHGIPSLVQAIRFFCVNAFAIGNFVSQYAFIVNYVGCHYSCNCEYLSHKRKFIVSSGASNEVILLTKLVVGFSFR